MRMRIPVLIAVLLAAAAGEAWARGGGGCFLPDTPVLRADGTATAICDVRPGDRLLAFTPDGAVTSAAVRSIVTHEADGYVIVTAERVVLRVTPEHPFYVGGGTFKTLDALGVGDCIFALDGDRLRPQKIRAIERVHAHTRVYNLQTDAPNTFFANGIAVHNKGGGCFPAGTPISTPAGDVPIDRLACGDVVLAIRDDGRIVAATVEQIVACRAPLLTITTDCGAVSVTADHPFRLLAGGFRPAGSVRPGDRLVALRRGRLQSARILRQTSAGQDMLVFNLQVASPHTFFAGGTKGYVDYPALAA